MVSFSQENEKKEFTKLVPLNGKVVNKNGLGIPHVVIRIYGTTLGGISQEDGSFEFLAPENQFFALIGWHPKYIHESFPVKMNSNHINIVLTEACYTIDFIKKEFHRSPDNIDKQLPKPMVILKEEEIIDFFDNDFPEYPGGGAGFWKQYGQEMDSFSIKNKGESRLKGVYHGTFQINQNGLMKLQNVEESISGIQKTTLQNFFLNFRNWEPVKWRGETLEQQFDFVIKFE